MYILRVVIFSLDKPNLTRITGYLRRIWWSIKEKEQVENIHLFCSWY